MLKAINLAADSLPFVSSISGYLLLGVCFLTLVVVSVSAILLAGLSVRHADADRFSKRLVKETLDEWARDQIK